ncbi:alpha/beta hydrolase [Enterovirga rhinocerotis]|uniref:Alpha/beta hydrolase n=1 Tax=Enterovirga rhinocerotis TaxID=1339210 RepID=A0A4R7C3Z1_9HYPH|nr:alpha/beta hydrolase [Enterovirga rhinocerotis]TDR93118.1 hypothetical protein EV668_0372 [Enterovirga rhinocerotis]
MFRRPALTLALGLALTAIGFDKASALSSPTQPKSGPGSTPDTKTEVVKRAIGKPGDVTYVFHAAAAPETPRSVVVVFHAWGATNPIVYGAWIDHLARRGHLVLYPGFQEVGRTRPNDATERAAALVKEALAELASDPQAKPDPASTIYLAHSAGTGVAVNLAARASELGVEAPKLVFTTMAGGIARDEASKGIQLADLSTMAPSINLVTMSGDQNNLAADRTSRRILREASNVPVERKLFMRAASDDHGFPSLTATLASPGGAKEGYGTDTIKLPAAEAPPPQTDARGRRIRQPTPARVAWSADAQLSGEQRVLLQQLQRNSVDTLDWLAYWRTFDMLIEASLAGNDLTALRQEPTFLDMGRWTDGWPVRRLGAEVPRAADAAATPVVPRAATPGSQIQSKQPVTRRRTEQQRRRKQ